jgi:hypothetical protein
MIQIYSTVKIFLKTAGQVQLNFLQPSLISAVISWRFVADKTL